MEGLHDPDGLLGLLLARAGAEVGEVAGVEIWADLAGAEREDVISVRLRAGWKAWFFRYGKSEDWTLVAVSPPDANFDELEKVDKSVFFAGSFPTGFIGKRRVQDAWRVMRAGAVVGSMCIGWITRHGRHEAHLAQIASLDPEKGVTSVYRTANDHQPTPCAELDWRIHPVRYNQEGAEWLWQHGRTMYKGYFGLLVAVSSAQKRLAKEGLCDYPVPQTDKRTVKRLKAFRK